MACQGSNEEPTTLSPRGQEERGSETPSNPESDDSGKKSLLGKLKDKTRTKVSQLKQKVKKKKSGDSSESSELKDDSSNGSSPSDEDENTSTVAKTVPDTANERSPEESAATLGAGIPSGTEDAVPDLRLGRDDTKPISHYRNEGPAGMMQAVPTQYRDYASEESQPAQHHNSPAIDSQESSEYLVEAGEVSTDTPYLSEMKKVEDADAQIPRGIEKPKDFDTVVY